MVVEVEGWSEVRLPGPVSQRNPALGKLALFDLAVKRLGITRSWYDYVLPPLQKNK